MLFAEFRKKRERKRSTNQQLVEDGQTASPLEAEPALIDPPHEAQKINVHQDTDDIHGLELKAYARKHDLSVEKLWEMIRTGQLVARTENGFVYVYGASFPQKQNTLPFPQQN